VTSESTFSMNATPFRVALTGDFYDSSGQSRYRNLGVSSLHESPDIVVSKFAEHRPVITADQLQNTDAVIVLTPRVTAESLAGASDLAIVARFGVGYDTVDVAACTAADVLLLITAGAVDRPVAEATVAWMLALTHHVRAKDRLVRESRWNDRSQYMGCELRGRTVGLIGFGGIGRETARLLAGFGMNTPLVYDPFQPQENIRAAGATPVTLDTLLAEADFVSLHCPLNEHTRGLIGAAQLAKMRPSSYFINTARGGIVDETALFDALAEHRIAGAAIDCFDIEPLTAAPRLAELENVLLAPHCIAWTDELFRDIGQTACRGIMAIRNGERPRGVINPEVFDRPGFQTKLKRITVQ